MKLKYYWVFNEDFLKWNPNMKFDVTIGNPPYQDGKQAGGQNKIYNQFCKKSLELLNDDGILCFVTPVSVTKKSKRFSLINQDGLKYIDFTTGKYFSVGIEICSWMIDKTYDGKVQILSENGEFEINKNEPIYDYGIHDKEFIDLYLHMKKITDTPEKRMFKQNNFGPQALKVKDDKHIYPLYKMEKTGDIKLTLWSQRIPYFMEKNKISIAMTKSLCENAICISKNNFDSGYMNTEIDSNIQSENIKSFILSDYFNEHSKKWKKLDGYGYNCALKYLPPFDKNKKWSNEDVKNFIENS